MHKIFALQCYAILKWSDDKVTNAPTYFEEQLSDQMFSGERFALADRAERFADGGTDLPKQVCVQRSACWLSSAQTGGAASAA